MRVFSGFDGGLLAELHADPPGDTAMWDGLGRALASAGDVNGDGRADLIAGVVGDDPAGISAAGTAWVFLGGCELPSTYCTAKINSQGCTPQISVTDGPSLSGPDDLAVHASEVLSHKAGLFVWGLGEANIPFAGGTLCVQAPLHRTPFSDSGGNEPLDCSGTYAFAFTDVYLQQQGLGPGTTVHVQCLARDPGFAPPESLSLTGGARFTLVP